MTTSIDPTRALAPRFALALEAEFGAEHRDVDPLLQWSDRADLQANCALGLAKRIGEKNPRSVAERLVAKLDASDIVERFEIAGPGFINITIKPEWLASQLSSRLGDPRMGIAKKSAPEVIVIDYSSPNVAKEMHVGHLRSTVIGDALALVLEWQGHSVHRQNHVGDWGTPFGMLIEHLLDLGETRAVEELGVGELNGFYQAARAKFNESDAFKDRARKRVVALQAGDKETLRLWKILVDESASYFATVYKKLDVSLQHEHIAGESFYNPWLQSVVEELEEKKLSELSDGAVCVFPPGFVSKEKKPLPLIVQKSDEGFGYAATDLAAIRYRTQTLKATRMLYVVGAPQAQHFAMVFAVAKMAGWLAAPARAEHVAFGSVLGADKKVFRTRSGDSVRLVDLIDASYDRALEVVNENSAHIPEGERSAIAKAVGNAAIKYADLSSDRVKDYVFDLDRMVQPTGDTGVYLLYAHARSRSILRKAEADAGVTVPAAGSRMVIEHPAEKRLVLQLSKLESVLDEVAATLAPHKLCAYLFDLSVHFNKFWDQCPVIKSEGDTRATRVALVAATADALKLGLSLLGISAPDRM
ncbi:MAG: arginine--tRNA ligase [Myxococcales bacterium]|nr:arginine--tRNA ligase [Myxococcales bacterium]